MTCFLDNSNLFKCGQQQVEVLLAAEVGEVGPAVPQVHHPVPEGTSGPRAGPRPEQVQGSGHSAKGS